MWLLRELRERTELRRQVAAYAYRLERVTKERDDARRQLQNVRVAHGPLHEAIYPDLHRPGQVKKAT